MKNFIKYRPEIDGLRAVAVIAVIFYHAELEVFNQSLFTGGFLGVDIFFVISGYLISKIILNEVRDTGRFSFLNFYKRRAKRILPMLFFVMIVSFPFVYQFVIPNFFVSYSKSIISSLFFASNFYFWDLGIGYDQLQEIQFQPFLHTWSLSVEEQFYFVFPITLIFLIKYFKKHLNLIIIIGLFLSLLLADWMSQAHASFNFYSLPSRGWELLAGTLIALMEIKRKKNKKNILNDVFPLVGIILILYSLISFNDRMFLPSFYSLVPIVGVCMIIWFSNKNDLITKLLSSKIFVGAGLISYSLYLWHYPIFILFNESNKIYLILLTIFLSILSYFFIEKPFRNKSIKSNFFNIRLLLSFFIVILILNSLVILKDGFYKPEKYPKIINDLMIEKYFSKKNQKKLKNYSFDESKKNIIIIGDSHMKQLSKVMKNNSNIKKYNFLELNNIGCYYILNFDKIQKYTLKTESYCNKQTQLNRREKILSIKDPIVIIGGRLPMYISGERYDNGEGGKEQREWWKFQGPKNTSTEQGVKNSIKDLLENNVKVILIYPVPPVGFDVMKKLFDNYSWNKNSFEESLKKNYLTTSYQNFLNYAKVSHETLDELKHPNLYKVYSHKIFCDKKIKNRCLLHDDEEIFYVDNNHLSKAGNSKLLEIVVKHINDIEKKNN
jgi:peptidoglycan/LPS O-acetylase OafA/YrhL